MNETLPTDELTQPVSVVHELFRFAERGLLLAMGSATLGCWGLMLLRLLSDIDPRFELATHPSLHAFVACSAILLIESGLFVLRRRSINAGPRWKRRLIFTLIPFCFFAWATTPWRLLPWLPAVQSEGSLKILAWNMLLVNRHTEEVIELIRREQPDIVVLIEVSPVAAEKLEALRSEYPYGLWMPDWQASGIVTISRLPDLSCRSLFPADTWLPAIELVINRGEPTKTLSILAVHTLSPQAGNATRTRIRDAQLKDLASWARNQQHAAMIVGDFNITPWSPPFWRLLDEANLKDSSRDRGYFPSWPAHFGRLGIPIDHALVNQQIKVLDRRNSYDFSHSDHCPILITIE